MTPSTLLTTSLKEWAVAVQALTEGNMILLLRKGGIREQSGSFTVQQRQFWLYPTYEHQKPHLLKPEYAHQVVPVAAGWHPEQVEISAWARVTHQFQVQEPEAVEALLPFHIWNREFVSERLKWKPKSPLTVLLLRVYRLPEVRSIPFQAEYGGCKSWIDLQVELSFTEAQPVLSDEVYRQQTVEIERVITDLNISRQ